MNDTITLENGVLDIRRKRIKKIDPAQSVHAGCSTLLVDHNDLARLDNVDTYGSLEKLSASHNQLIRMYGVGRLYSLCHLNLSHNNIAAIEGLRDLTHLTYLNLSGNNIKAIEHLNHCKELQHIDLSENAITNITDLSYLKSLKKLFLNGNRIKSLQFAEKCFPISLDTLALAENQIVDLNEMGRLCHLTALEQFSFSGNPCITGNDLEFDYRPFTVNWLLSLKILDGEIVNEKERLKGEWLYSQGKGRHFKPGEHEAAVEYLNRNFPSPKIGRSVTGINENEEERLEKVLRMSKMHHSVPPLNFGSDEEESSTSMSARSNSTSVSNGRKGQESMQGVSASPGVSKRVFARKVALTSGNPTPNVTQKVRCRSPDNGTPIPTRRSVEKHTKSGEDMMSRSFDPTALQSHLKAPEKQAKKNGSDSTAPNTPIKKSSVKSTDEDFSDLSDVCDSSEVVCASLTLKKEGIKTLIPHPQSRNPVPKSPNNTIPRPKRSISVQPGRASSKLKSPSPPKEKEECLESDNRSLRLPKVPPRSALPQSKHSPKVGTVEDNAAIKIQKVWRGYQTRNLDPKVSGFKQEIRQSRAEKHILNIYDQLRLAKKELEEEKRLRNEQSRLNDELKAEIQELTNKMAAPDSAPSSNVLQLSETCYQLQKQVEQLQLCMENLTKSLELVAKASVSPRPTTLEFVKEATCSELPSSDDVSIDVRSFASTMVKQLIQEAVTGNDDEEKCQSRKKNESELNTQGAPT
ncbi:centrosomal protein of 97 kDa-like [Artemia franciscana]|uniref:centrosomal protein of 97 kDa-like n=1 Tax=Artemia franciscana TaxID=6661 RepID=UPI0032D9AF98